MGQLKGGIIQFQADGATYDAKGAFTHNIMPAKREAVVGSSGVHGFKQTPQVPYIAGKITDDGSLDLKTLFSMTNATVTLQEANGKTVMLRGAYYAGSGEVETDEGEIDIRFEGKSGEEV